MTDREFDQHIKRVLNNHQPEFDPASWEMLEERMDAGAVDPSFDEAIRASLSQFTPDNATGDWSRMEQVLVEEEQAFDATVKEKVEQYEALYDPATWPVLSEKLTADERLRRRLVTAKILEIAAIIVALLTFYNFFPAIQSNVIEPTGEYVRQHFAQNEEGITSDAPGHTKSNTPSIAENAERDARSAEEEVSTAFLNTKGEARLNTQSDYPVTTYVGQAPVAPLERIQTGLPAGHSLLLEGLPVDEMPVNLIAAVNPEEKSREKVSLLLRLASPLHTVMSDDPGTGLSLAALTLPKERGLRITMGASADVNVLYIPDDHFFTQGRQIKFGEKELVALGYSAGASVLFDRGPFTFETGLYYSAKTYEPNRILHIGETFDVRTLDFRQINLSIVSVPLYVHWNFDRKGKVHLYTVAGMNMNVLAIAHYDLIAKNNLQSAAAPQDPQYRRTTQEVERVRENILDGAEFSTKSFITVSGGFGIERQINTRFSIFGQPTFNYQIPFFGIADQNGKHLQFGSLLLGTRITLK